MRSPSVLVVDDFLNNPDETRLLALQQEYVFADGYKGRRSKQSFLSEELRVEFERLLGRKIVRWTDYEVNGVFQFCTPEDAIVYHCDAQTHAGIIFLTPDAPAESGTTLVRSKTSKARRFADDEKMFEGGFYDPTRWEKLDTIGNVYNRLVLWEGSLAHAASCYFGQHVENARLFQIFFFDCE